MGSLEDRFGRQHDYLRISVTDRCNLRCIYCMPPDGIDLCSKKEILSYEDLYRITKVAVNMGIEKVRITGGEPFVRRNLLDFIERVSSLEGLEKLAVTTNGLLLKDKLARLEQTRLNHINISLDSLDNDRFNRITRGAQLTDVVEAIDGALNRGFTVKVNVVALNDLTDSELDSFAAFAKNRNIEVRFIEFMPLCGEGWNPDRFNSLSDIKSYFMNHYELTDNQQPGVSDVFEFKNDPGKIGFIASLTDSFCESCSRLRLSSDGVIYPCLFSRHGVQLKPYLDEEVPDRIIESQFEKALEEKWEGNPAYTGEWDPETEKPEEDFALIRSIGG